MAKLQPTLNQADIELLTTLIDQRLEKQLDQQLEKHIEKHLAIQLEKKLKPIHKDIKIVIECFDREYLEHDKRIARIENQINLDPNPIY